MEFAHKMLPSDGAAAPTIRNSIYALPSTSSMQAAAHIYAARLLWCGEGEKETMELHKFDRVLVEGEMEYRKKQWRHFQLGNRLFQNLSTTKGCSGRRKTRKRPFKAVPVFSPSLPWQGIMFNLREVLSVLCRKNSFEFLTPRLQLCEYLTMLDVSCNNLQDLRGSAPARRAPLKSDDA